MIPAKRVQSIDLLRGMVMIVMAIDHIRVFFHSGNFLYDPVDLQRTTVAVFLTRWITHYCAPVFLFLAGASAFLYGDKRGKRALSFFVFTRGAWLVLVEVLIISLETSFNPAYPYFNLQVIWAIGICMLTLSALVYLDKKIILAIGLIIVGAHNLLDHLHAQPGTLWEVLWSFLHEPRNYNLAGHLVIIKYPVLPWMGIMCLGYYLGHLFTPAYDSTTRQQRLLYIGCTAIALFVILRAGNWYGDAAPWSVQKDAVFTVLSFINVTKYPPSLLYALITLGPACLFLVFVERHALPLASKISLFGRVPFFYYIVHWALIHALAMIGAACLGYRFTDMILTERLVKVAALKGYGFPIWMVYIVWVIVIVVLYPLCVRFDKYKRAHQGAKKWLSYL